ncbi:hypothetical protein FB45DRAFT_1060142, partial [Roridomyces roridus]
MSKKLYTFGYSVWSAAAEIARWDLGYPEDEISLEIVDLFKGENFDPAFLKLNPNGTLPTLVAPGRVYTNSADVISYLVQNPPAERKSATPGIIEAIHDDKYEPNLGLLVDIPEGFVRGDGPIQSAADVPGLYIASTSRIQRPQRTRRST